MILIMKRIRIEALYERVSQHESIEVAMPLAEQFWGGKMAVY